MGEEEVVEEEEAAAAEEEEEVDRLRVAAVWELEIEKRGARMESVLVTILIPLLPNGSDFLYGSIDLIYSISCLESMISEWYLLCSVSRSESIDGKS